MIFDDVDDNKVDGDYFNHNDDNDDEDEDRDCGDNQIETAF